MYVRMLVARNARDASYESNSTVYLFVKSILKGWTFCYGVPPLLWQYYEVLEKIGDKFYKISLKLLQLAVYISIIRRHSISCTFSKNGNVKAMSEKNNYDLTISFYEPY